MILPSHMQNLSSITHLQRTVIEPDHSDAGYTTRTRLSSTRYPLDKTDLHVNWNKQARNRESTHFNLQMIQTQTPPPPKHSESYHENNPYPDRHVGARINGEVITLPSHYYGTWGNSLPPREISVYTDGSRTKSQDTEATGSWAAVLHDDSF